jgi:hypothetical protein
MFRAKFLDGLARLWSAGELDSPDKRRFPPDHLPHEWLRQWRRRPWVVYSQPPFAGPRKLLDYLCRYTHRAAIGNERLVAYDGRHATFSYRDRTDGDRVKLLKLEALEFLSRFVTHVLPDRFQRIRHYGFLANRGKAERLARIRAALGAYEPLAVAEPLSWSDWLTGSRGARRPAVSALRAALALRRTSPPIEAARGRENGGTPSTPTNV